MKIRTAFFLAVSILFFLASDGRNFYQSTYIPKDGYVPNEETAIKVAEAIWLPIYGDEAVEGCKPVVAKLINSTVWVVKGTGSPHQKGGVLYAEIRKSDCKILKVIGEK